MNQLRGLKIPSGAAGLDRSSRTAAGLVALGFLALHLPFLPSSLEDLDSINFALGLHRFDVGHHQPHPPGYPLFIAVGKLSRLVLTSDAHALALVSALAGAAGVFATSMLFSQLDRGRDTRRWPMVGVLIAVTSPLYWFTSVRPLSDVSGLVAALAVQAITIRASETMGFAAAGFWSGVSTGLRSQVAWLTLPLIGLSLARQPAGARRRSAGFAILAWVAGTLLWAVPLVMLSGGPRGYWHALSSQGAEDLSGIQMLWTTRTPRQLAAALYFAFIAPWAVWQLAAVVLLFAAVGLVRMSRQTPATALTLGIAFVPYLVFDLLFQETFTTRYALPLVIPVAYLAVWAMSLPRRAAWQLGGLVTAWSLAITVFDVRAYARMPAPAFRMLDEMRVAAATLQQKGIAPVLASHRREDLDLRRPVVWLADARPRVGRQLDAPPKHEWLEVVKYWNNGGRRPVWFVGDPLRSDLALFDHQATLQFRWPLSFPVLIGGVRPNEMDWHTYDRPGWYLGEGWALTPEAAGVAEEDRRGPSIAPVEGWIRRRSEGLTIVIGGRNMSAAPTPVHVTLDHRVVDDRVIAPGFFLDMFDLPAGALIGAADYAPLTVSAGGERVAIEQFDAQSAGRPIFGYSDGWHEPEYNPSTGRVWRWTSERAVLRVRSGGRPVRLSLEGEPGPPNRPSHVTVRVGGRTIAEEVVSRSFSWSVGVPANRDAAEQTITIETDKVYIPAEYSRRTSDRRHLGLRIYRCVLTPAS